MKHKQIVFLLLALLLFFSCLPFPVQAEEMNADSGTGDDSVDAFYDANEASFDEELLNDDWWKAYVDDDSTEDEADGTWDELSKEDESDDQETAEDPAWHDNGEQDDSLQNGDEDRNESLPDTEPDESDSDLSLKEVIQQYGYAYVLTTGETVVYPGPEQAEAPIFVLTDKDSVLLATGYRKETDAIKVWFIGDDGLFFGYVSSSCLKDKILTDDEVDAYTDLYWWDWAETEAGTLYAFVAAGYAMMEEMPETDFTDYEEWTDGKDESENVENEESFFTEDIPEEEAPAVQLNKMSTVRGVSLLAANTASSFTGSETIRLGKESSNITGIFLQNNGSQSTSIARHWVTVNGTEYTAFCIEASKSATSGRDGNVESSTDAGLQWIMINVSDSSDEDYAIKQQAIWYYLGQSYSPSNLKAGSRCSLSTDELRARLESIVSSANNASYNSRYELWLAYHTEWRSNYQDMIFITTAPVPTPTPYVPTPTPYVPTATPYVPTPTPYIPTPKPTATPTAVPTATPTQKPTATPYIPTATPYVPPTATPYIPTATPYIPPTATPFVPTPTPEPTQGWIRITKTDSVTGQGLAGIVFDIYRGSTLVDSMTTNANGIAISSALTKGSYTVKERNVPTGYVADLVTLSCEVKAEQITSLTAENTPIQVRIKVIKTDAQTKQPLSGAQFSVMRKGTSAVLATLTTNAQGEAITNLLPYGQYTVTESKVPSGYIDSGFSVTVNGTENGKTYVVEAENSPMQGGIRITKTDKVDGSDISGVIFEIYQGSTLVGSMTTNASGVAVSGELSQGSYTVKEKALPQGYTGNLVSLDCTVKSGEITDLKAENQPIQFTVKIVKTDALTHEPLAGAQFTITRKDTGAVAATLTTNNNGEATSGLLRYGVYEIKETKVPANYVDSDFTATINGTEHGKTYVIEAENSPMQGGIRITKTDKLDGSGISGVIFDIYQDSMLVGSMTTNESGVAVSGDLPKGNYAVKEKALPQGYSGDLVSLDCSVKSGEITDLRAENQPIQFTVKIVKTDALTHEPLAGAQFTITRKDTGAVAASLTTNNNGEATSSLLRYGEYEIKETKIPANYIDSSFRTTINGTEHGKTYVIEAENQPMAGGIRVTKTDKLDGSPISGVVFDIYQGSTLIGSMTTRVCF